MKQVVFLILFSLLSVCAFAQINVPLQQRQYNFYSFSRDTKADPTEVDSSSSSKNHPEYGLLPFNAGCHDCVEILEKRKEDERYFIMNGSNGKEFAIQKSFTPLHYKDVNGKWITIDHRIRKVNDRYFTATQQPFPLEIDLTNGFTSLIGMNKIFFNQQVKMFDLDGNAVLKEQNPSDSIFFTAGDDGVEQRNFFPGVYRQMIAERGSLETNYILQHKPEISDRAKWLVFQDEWTLPKNYLLKKSDDGYTTPDGIWIGDLIIVNEKGEEEFRISKPVLFDSKIENDRKINSPVIGYRIERIIGGWKCMLLISADWINDKERDYPVTIDPTVSVTATYASAVYGGSGYANNSWGNGGCGYTVNLNFPANAQASNAAFSATYSTSNGCSNSCVMADGAFDITGPCGRSPVTPNFYWTCPANTPGSCTASSLAEPALIDCLAPSCTVTPVQLTLKLRRSYCVGSGSCDNTCIRLDPNSYSITLYGITVQSSITSSSGSFNVCSGFPVTYTAHPLYGVPPYSFVWNPGGVTGSPVTFNPTVNSTYTLITTDACGNTVQSQTLAFILLSSTATFTTPSPICITQTASFTYTGNGVAATTYLWNFNDPGSGAANTSTLQNPTHTFSAPGFYTVSLVATLGTCVSAPYTQSIFVSPQPTATFTVSTPACLNQSVTVTYTGNAPAGATYNWNFAGGTIVSGSGQGPYDIQWSTSGNHTVTLQVVVGICTSPNFSQVVQVLNPPTATINVATPICEGQNCLITYTGNGGAGATYNWGFSGGTIVSGSNSGPYQINWSAAGTYTVTLTLIKNGCITIAPPQTVTVNPIPTSSFTINPGSNCVNNPFTITYTGNAGAAATYSWIFGAGSTIISGSGQGPYQVSWATSGTKNVKLTVTENGCTSTQIINQVTVTPAISSSFSVTSPVCVNQNSSITYTGNASASAVYTWNFGGGIVASGTGQGPYQVHWSNWGNHYITLSVSQNGCFSQPDTQIVFVNPTPSSNIVVGTACENDTTIISCSGAWNSSNIYTWNFGSANVLYGIDDGPYGVVWPTAGTYNVSLTVSLNGCISPTTTVAVTVLQLPTSTFNVVSPACAGGGTIVTYTGNANSQAPYNWYFGGGQIISGGGPGPWVISYPNPGIYPITLVVYDFGCVSVLGTESVVVNPIPTATFNISPSICENTNTTITYTGTASSSAVYNWNLGGGIIANGNGQGPLQVYWTTAGPHTVSLTVTEGGCTSPAVSHSINVLPAPVADFNTTSPICSDQNSTITFTGSASASAAINWNFGSATVLSGSGIGPYLLSFASAGTYPVTLTIVDNGCTSVSTQNISVYAVQTASFTVTPISACVNAVVNVVYTGTGNGTAFYDWNFGGGIISNGNGQGPYNITFSDTGTYLISLAVTQVFCTSDTQSISIHLNPTPVVDFTAAPLFACDNLTAVFANNSSGAINYQWNFGDGVTDTIANPSHNYSVGLYDVTLTAINQFGCTDTKIIPSYINVQPTPTAQFTSSPLAGLELALDENDFTFENLSLNGTAYQWTFGDGDSSGIMNPNHIYKDTGTFFVTLIAYNDVGCYDSISQGPYLIVPGAFIFIPNAFTPNGDGKNEVFRIFGHTIASTAIQIFNRWGELIYEGDGYQQGWDGTYKGKPENTGVYVYRAVITKNSGLTVTLQGDLTLIR
ncbi:MAG: PKD domain-containing protein [Bacteroidota bacterium]